MVRYLLTLFSLLLASQAHAARAVMEQIPATGNTIMVSTSNTRVGIATGTPQATLDVLGNAQFGSGATRSTFSTTGDLSLATNADIVLGGSSGYITTVSSVNASAFFGSGAALTGIAGETNTYASSKTFTSDVLAKSSVTANAFFGDGSHLTGLPSAEANTYASSKTFTSDVLGKSSVTANAFFGDGSHLTGIASEVNTYTSSKTFTSDVLAKSSVTANAFFGDGSHLTGVGADITVSDEFGGSETQTSFSVCLATVSITTTGGCVVGWLSATTSNSVSTYGCFTTVLLDGAFLSGYSATYGISSGFNATSPYYANQSWFRSFGCPPAGAHDYCLSIRATAGGSCIIDNTRQYTQFGVMELQ